MKRVFLLIILLPVLLTGCVERTPSCPEEIEIGGITYKTGFYGNLFPNNFEFTDIVLSKGNNELHQIVNEKFDLYHADIGNYTSGTIYCEESCYDEAIAYYNNPDNYEYFCTMSNTIRISEVDPEMFNALLGFLETSNYDPFDSKHNSAIDKVELPMPETLTSCMVFFKESKDGLFVSGKGNDCYFIDGTLYAIYQYDYGHGEYEKLIAVKAPEYLSNYFLEFMKSYL